MYDNRHKLEHLKAEDLFCKTYTQVFCAKTGKYIGIIDQTQMSLFDLPEEKPEEKPQEDDPNQLSLF